MERYRIGESANAMAKRRIATGDPSLFPCYLIGQRRILIARQGFIDWLTVGRQRSHKRKTGGIGAAAKIPTRLKVMCHAQYHIFSG
jgi:hypothetical protein